MSGRETHMARSVHSLERIPEDESIGSFGVKRKNGETGEFTFFLFLFKTRSVYVVNCETLPFFFAKFHKKFSKKKKKKRRK